ncbi:MAG: DMT family transporter [Thermoplasmata archaeon]
MAPGAPGAPPRFAGADLVLLGSLAVLWGLAYVYIRQGIVAGASPLAFAGSRYALSAIVFLTLAAARREPWPDRRSLAVSAIVGGILVIGLYGGLLYWGEQSTTGGYASVLAATAPILTVVLAFGLLPSERLGSRAIAGVLIAFVGVIVLVAPTLAGGAVGTWPGPEFVLAALVSVAVGTVLLRRFGTGRQGLWQIGTQFAVGGALLGAATALLPVPEALPASTEVWTALAILVVLSSVMGYWVYFLLHHRVGPVRANLVAYLVPLVGIGIGSGIFGEAVTLWEIVGFLIVVGGLTLVLREREARPRRRPPPDLRDADATDVGVTK